MSLLLIAGSEALQHRIPPPPTTAEFKVIELSSIVGFALSSQFIPPPIYASLLLILLSMMAGSDSMQEMPPPLLSA